MPARTVATARGLRVQLMEAMTKIIPMEVVEVEREEKEGVPGVAGDPPWGG